MKRVLFILKFFVLSATAATVTNEYTGQQVATGSQLSNVATGGGGGCSGTEFITGQSLGALENDLNFEVGITRTIGAADVTVVALNRWVVSGNSQVHTLKIRDSSGAVLGSVTVNCSGATSGQYLEGCLGTPVNLTHGQTYWFLSTETAGGDQWYNQTTTITHTAVATDPSNGGGYWDGSALGSTSANDAAFGPVGFKTSP